MEQPEKLSPTSFDIKQHQLEKLRELFPEVFTESNKVDWDKLRLTLGEQIDVGKERFGMNWPGKADCFKTIQQPSIATLVPSREESVDFDTTQNLFIEGDNLEVLKLLQKSYLGKVKMIYIDPPYNTGNEFIYPDNYSENLQTYLEYTGQVDSEGKKFSTNSESDGRFHSKWINMIYPRLFLAKNLLKEDGAIFISIDDNEVGALRFLCNEIFGEENFIGQFIWKRRQNSDNRNQSNISSDHEYIVAYSRYSQVRFLGKDIDVDKYKNPDNDSRGAWASTNLSGLATKEQRPNLHFDIVNPETGISYSPNPKRGWSKSKPVIEKMISEGRILFPKSVEGKPREKKFLNDLRQLSTGFSTWLNPEIVGYTTNGTREVSELMGGKHFDFPKPISLLKELIKQATIDNDIVLDFFAGSGTTAHSVMKLNLQEGTHRKYICVQLPEPLNEESDAFKMNLRTIADVSKERIRRAIKELLKTSKEEELRESQNLFKVDRNRQIDFGFKVFKLRPSNFTLWKSDTEKTEETISKQLELSISHILATSSSEAILFEVLLKSGFELTTPIQKEIIANKIVHSVAEGELLICLEKELNQELIKGIADKIPTRVICLDEGFQNNDQLKTNAVQIMKSKGVTKFQTI